MFKLTRQSPIQGGHRPMIALPFGTIIPMLAEHGLNGKDHPLLNHERIFLILFLVIMIMLNEGGAVKFGTNPVSTIFRHAAIAVSMGHSLTGPTDIGQGRDLGSDDGNGRPTGLVCGPHQTTSLLEMFPTSVRGKSCPVRYVPPVALRWW